MGEGKLFKAILPEPVCSLLFRDHFVSPVTDSLFFLNCGIEEKTWKNVRHASVNLGSACK